MCGCPGSTDPWQRCPHCILGQEGLGSNVGLLDATIPVIQSGDTELLLEEKTLLAKTCSWTLAGCGKGRKVLCVEDCPLFLEMGEVFWEGNYYVPIAHLWLEVHWQGEVLLCHSEHVPHSVSVLGSVTKACMILRSIEELQHKPGMVSKTQSELCEVLPLYYSFVLPASCCLLPLFFIWPECLQGIWAHLPCLGQRWDYCIRWPKLCHRSTLAVSRDGLCLCSHSYNPSHPCIAWIYLHNMTGAAASLVCTVGNFEAALGQQALGKSAMCSMPTASPQSAHMSTSSFWKSVMTLNILKCTV